MEALGSPRQCQRRSVHQLRTQRIVPLLLLFGTTASGRLIKLETLAWDAREAPTMAQPTPAFGRGSRRGPLFARGFRGSRERRRGFYERRHFGASCLPNEPEPMTIGRVEGARSEPAAS